MEMSAWASMTRCEKQTYNEISRSTRFLSLQPFRYEDLKDEARQSYREEQEPLSRISIGDPLFNLKETYHWAKLDGISNWRLG